MTDSSWTIQDCLNFASKMIEHFIQEYLDGALVFFFCYSFVAVGVCLWFRGEDILLFLVQTVGRQLVEQRQYRPSRVRGSGGTARKHVSTAEMGP